MPKRILFVHPCAGMGGAPLSLLYLIEQLDPQRYEAEVLFIGTGGPEVDLYRQRGIPLRLRSDITSYSHAHGAYLSLRSLRPWQVLTRPLQILPSARRMRDELRSHPVDLVHINTSVMLPAGLGAAWAGVPVVWHMRELLRPGLVGLRRWFVRTCIHRSASAVIAISKCSAASLLPGPQVRVIYNFVNFDQFDHRLDGQQCRAALGVPPESPIVLMLGGLVASKGADVFVKAASIVRERFPRVIFLLVGYGPGGESPSWIKRVLRRCAEGAGLVPSMERRVLGLIRKHGLEDTVRLTGVRSDVPQFLAASTLLVWPATVPHFARPIIEAGAMARPVVASDFPASREIVVSDETGVLVRPGDAVALAEGIMKVLADRNLATRMGEAGFRLAQQRYRAREGAAAVMALYDEVLGLAEGTRTVRDAGWPAFSGRKPRTHGRMGRTAGMRALVTGGAGFIGSNVVREALSAGWDITVLDNFSTGYPENLPPGDAVRLVRGDVRDPAAVDEALHGVEAVFHLAAAVGNVRSIEDPSSDSDINILGTIRVLEGMRKAGLRRLVFSSSAAIFGEPRRMPIDEDHPAEPDSPYGVSKLSAEKHCLCYGRLYDWDVACLRYFNVYGVNQRFDAYGNVIPIFGTRLLRGEPLVIYGDGEQTRDFVDVRDVARANRLALERRARGPFNIGSGQATTVNILASLITGASGLSSEVTHQPPRAGEVRQSAADIRLATKTLGYVPSVPLTAGLRDYMAWFATI